MRTVTLPPLSSRPAVELMRVSVFEAKLLTQTDCPAGATEGAGASLAGRAMRIGSPTFFPECTSIRVTVPSSWSVTNSEPAATTSQLGFVPTRIGSPTGRSERGSSRTTLPSSLVGEPDASAGDDDPDREPADVHPLDRARRRVDPQHLPGVGGRHPEVAATGGQRQGAAGRESKRSRGRRERPRVEPQQRPGSFLERPQLVAADDDLVDRPVEPVTVQHGAAAPVENCQLGRARSRRAGPRQSSRSPTRARCETSPPRYTVCATAPVARSRRRSGRSPAGFCESPLSATQSASGPAITAPGWPGTGRVAVTPSVVVFSPESRIASSTEPATAATTEAVSDRDPEAAVPRIARRRRGCVHAVHHPTARRGFHRDSAIPGKTLSCCRNGVRRLQGGEARADRRRP